MWRNKFLLTLKWKFVFLIIIELYLQVLMITWTYIDQELILIYQNWKIDALAYCQMLKKNSKNKKLLFPLYIYIYIYIFFIVYSNILYLTNFILGFYPRQLLFLTINQISYLIYTKNSISVIRPFYWRVFLDKGLWLFFLFISFKLKNYCNNWIFILLSMTI